MTHTTKFALIVLLLLPACTSKLPDGVPELQPVALTFTQGGRPLAGAEVMLLATDPEQRRWGAGGTTGAKGELAPVTLGRYPGVAAGSYKIVVKKIELEPSTFVGEATPEREAEFLAAEAKRKGFSLVPIAYTALETTPLAIDVVAGKNDAKTFDLGEPVREALPVAAP